MVGVQECWGLSDTQRQTWLSQAGRVFQSLCIFKLLSNVTLIICYIELSCKKTHFVSKQKHRQSGEIFVCCLKDSYVEIETIYFQEMLLVKIEVLIFK